MKKILPVCIIIALCTGHTMFLKFDTFFLEPNTSATLQLFNGTFDLSENVIDRNRMLDASIVSNGKRVQVQESQWTEKDNTTFLNFQTGDEGTYVAGISTKARSLKMEAKAFNDYLEHEGIYDMLEWREKNEALDSSANEKYSKHVKTIFQVGETRTSDWQTNLGYPIEFVPLENPYSLHTGDSLAVQLLRNGQPLANQLVYADFKATGNGHSHDNEEGHTHSAGGDTHHEHDDEKADKEPHSHATGQQLRTDDNGMVKAHLHSDGIWYFQTIHLVQTQEEDLTHESNWTTLTFEVTHAHGADTHTHEHESHFWTYIFIIGSLLLIVILYFWFNRKNKVDAQ